MPYFRRPKDHENTFAQIPNDLLEDPNLSFKAKGLLSYLLSRSNEWNVYQAQLENIGPDGETSTRSALEDLIEAGYIHRFQKRENGKFGEYVYIICEEPRSNVDAPETWFSEIGDSETGKSRPTNTNTYQHEKGTNTESEARARERGEAPVSLQQATQVAEEEDINQRLAREWWHHYNARGWPYKIHSVSSALKKWEMQEKKMSGDDASSASSPEELCGKELTEGQIRSLLPDFPGLSRSDFGYVGQHEIRDEPLYSYQPEKTSHEAEKGR
jgi:hypothetical protein